LRNRPGCYIVFTDFRKTETCEPLNHPLLEGDWPAGGGFGLARIQVYLNFDPNFLFQDLSELKGFIQGLPHPWPRLKPGLNAIRHPLG
jgi:hypothetical protein